MNVELLAIIILIAWSVFTFIIESVKSRSQLDLEAIKTEFQEVVDNRLQEAIDTIKEAFSEVLTQPLVKRAMTIISTQGVQAREENSLTRDENSLINDMATDMLESPQFSVIRMGAKTMGLDIESYIEENGALKTIQAVQQLSKVAGIDLMKLDLGKLSISGNNPKGSGNPYLRR